MARTDARFRAAYNQLLDMLGDQDLQTNLPSEIALSKALKVSRTIVRTALAALEDAQIIQWDGRSKILMRKPKAKDRLAARDDYISQGAFEGQFLDWVLRFDVPAGTPLNVAQLAKRFSVAPHSLQEFLAGLSQFGLVERRPRGGWLLLGFTPEYAVELSDFRAVLEANAAKILSKLPDDHPIWDKLAQLESAHLSLLDRIATDFHDFSRLDEKFHATLNSVVQNRFVVEFQKVISLIFHYHYQWDKTEERDRNQAAIGEHLAIIAALTARDSAAAVATMESHLRTSKQTLLSSLRGNHLA